MRTEEQERLEDARAARLLADLSPPLSAATQRVRARVLASERPSAAVRGKRLVAVAGVASLAAAGLLYLTQKALEPVPAAPVAVAAALETAGTWAIDTSIPNVALSYDGKGEITGTSDAPHIRWDAGTLNVEVTPDQGIKLAVETREGVVRVVGTGFTVKRGLGTYVEVRHGRVEVDCGTELTRVLEAGDSVTCLPRTAAGMLGHANAIRGEGAGPRAVLEVIDRGLAMPDKSAALTLELMRARYSALVELGRHAEALEAARILLADPVGQHRDEVIRSAVATAVALGGCETAAPWLPAISPAAAEACAQ